jgi:hypothetical protein
MELINTKNEFFCYRNVDTNYFLFSLSNSRRKCEQNEVFYQTYNFQTKGTKIEFEKTLKEFLSKKAHNKQ